MASLTTNLESLAQVAKKNDTAFMDIIKEFPVLYNRACACADFKDRNIKNNAWRKISELLDIEESKCVKRYERISISSCASMLLKCCYICVQFSILAHFPFPAKFVGQTSCEYPIYRQNLGWSATSKIPDRLGFSRHMLTIFVRLPITIDLRRGYT